MTVGRSCNVRDYIPNAFLENRLLRHLPGDASTNAAHVRRSPLITRCTSSKVVIVVSPKDVMASTTRAQPQWTAQSALFPFRKLVGKNKGKAVAATPTAQA
jgi:hypothetical protein